MNPTAVHSSTTGPATSVSVLGLGAMGSALARAFLTAGHPTTVWNRTAERADALALDGASVAPSPSAAITASELTVVCVLDRNAVDVVVGGAVDALPGATVVNLTSSTPEDARQIAARVTRAGAQYLDGKIMVPTPLIGTDEALVLYSGEGAVFDRWSQALRALGGDADLVGDDPGLAALYDLGMLGVFFNGMAAFLHAVALVGADGIEARRFVPYAQRITGVLQHTLPGLAADVDRGVHAGDEDNLAMELAALEHIVHASALRGIDTTVPEMPRALAGAAVSAGHGRDGFSRVIDVLRRR